MAMRNVKLKNRSGDYLYPYTENIPTASTSMAGKVKLDSSPTSGSNNAITSGAVYTALSGKLSTTGTAAKATADASGNNIANTYLAKTGTAAKATADADGNNIANTYLKKTDTAAKATADADNNNIATTYLKKNMPVTTLATSGTIALADNSINRIAPTGTVTFSLPSVSDNTVFHQILVQMTLSTSRTINLGTTKYFTGSQPSFAAGTYDILYEYNGSNWVVGAVVQA